VDCRPGRALYRVTGAGGKMYRRGMNALCRKPPLLAARAFDGLALRMERQRGTGQTSFNEVARSRMACLPSPNIISVLSMANSGLGSPAKPGDSERLTTTTVRAL